MIPLDMAENQYGVEIVGDIAYTSYMGEVSPYSKGYADNDIVDTAEKCLNYIRTKNIKEVYGPLKKMWEKEKCNIIY